MKAKSISKTYYICLLIVVLSLITLLFTGSKAVSGTYDYNAYTIKCECHEIEVGTLISADWDQSTAAQNTAWESFKSTYGLSDTDWLGNRTKKYNCHAYALLEEDSQNYWLNSGYLESFFDNGTNCWYYDMSYGYIKVGSHSCYVNCNIGKCGGEFLCKNNQLVYGASMPTSRYNKYF